MGDTPLDGPKCEGICVSMLIKGSLWRGGSHQYQEDKMISRAISQPLSLARTMTAQRTHKQNGHRGKQTDYTWVPPHGCPLTKSDLITPGVQSARNRVHWASNMAPFLVTCQLH